MSAENKLDLGSNWGTKRCPEFTCVDTHNADVIWDLCRRPYPWDSNSVELIHSSHTLEHLNKEDAYGMLEECYRVLIPNGIITLAVPDLDIYIHNNLTPGGWDSFGDHMLRDLNHLGGDPYHELPEMRHRYIWCEWSLKYVLQEIGYVGVIKHGFRGGPYDDLFPNAYNQDHDPITLYISCRKGT